MSAAIPHGIAQKAPPAEQKGAVSHGRGGAGNIGNAESDFDLLSLETPTLKGDVYATGRGGSGNMSKNTELEATAHAQDVFGVPLRQSTSATHVGRGGSANTFDPNATGAQATNKTTSNLASTTDIAAITASNTAANAGTKTGAANTVPRQETAAEKKARLAYERSLKGLANVGKEWLVGKVRMFKRGSRSRSSVHIVGGSNVGNVSTGDGGDGSGAIGNGAVGIIESGDGEDEDVGGSNNGITRNVKFSASTTALHEVSPIRVSRLKKFKSMNFRRG